MFIYLAEAHSSDWPLSHQPPAPHASANDRAEAAKRLVQQQPWLAQLAEKRIYIDDVENEATKRLGLWPERYALLEGPTVRWASSLDFEHRFSDVLSELRAAAGRLWR